MKGRGEKKFKKVIKSPNIEWCSFVARPERDPNPLVRMILQLIKLTVPGLFDKQCPWAMKIKVVNLKVPRQFSILLPNGVYQYRSFIDFPKKSVSASVTLHFTFEIF